MQYPLKIPAKKYANAYRYGFNGKETDQETKWQDYGFRMYNPNLARFFSVDPITKAYPELTPYQFASNTPIQAIDLDGLEAWFTPFILASRPTPVIRPVTEAIVETQVGKPRWNPNTSVTENIKNIQKTGRDAHLERQAEWKSEGFVTEKALGKGNRLDGLKIDEVEGVGTIRELKPNSTGGRKAGLNQLKRYLDAAKEAYPDIKEWKPELELYNSKTGVVPSDATKTDFSNKKLMPSELKNNNKKANESNERHEKQQIEQKAMEKCPDCV